MDYEKALNKVMEHAFVRHRGVLGERVLNGILYDGKIYSEEEFKKEVEIRIQTVFSRNKLKNER